MPFTSIANVIDPQVLADQVSARFPDKLVVGSPNLVDVDTDFPLGSPGTLLQIPFWKRIAAFATLTEGTALVPSNVTAVTESATVQRAGAAFEVYDTAQLVSKSDPVAEIAGQIARRAAEFIDSQLVAEIAHTPNVFDQSVSAAQTNVNGIWDQSVAIKAMVTTVGDNYGELLKSGAIIMHSKVLGDLLLTGAIQNQYQSGMNTLQTGMIPHLSGLPIIVSDRVTQTTQSTKALYSSYIIGKNALALFYQRQVQV